MKKALFYILGWYIVTVILHFMIFALIQPKLVYDLYQLLFGLIIAIPCSLFGGFWSYSYDQKILNERDRALKYRTGGEVYDTTERSQENTPIIIDGRIVSDPTFATRFISFIKDIKVHDAASFDEKEYMELVARELLEYQIATAIDKDEIEYLKRCNPKEYFDKK